MGGVDTGHYSPGSTLIPAQDERLDEMPRAENPSRRPDTAAVQAATKTQEGSGFGEEKRSPGSANLTWATF